MQVVFTILKSQACIRVTAILLLTAATSLHAEGTEARTVGPWLALGGPFNGISSGVMWQASSWLEVAIGIAGGITFPSQHPPSSDPRPFVTSFVAPYLRGRWWPLTRHSPILDLGVGMVRTELRGRGLTAGNGTDSVGEAWSYERADWQPFGYAGVGYGFRDSSWRVNVSAGLRSDFGVPVTNAYAEQDTPAGWHSAGESLFYHQHELFLYGEIGVAKLF